MLIRYPYELGTLPRDWDYLEACHGRLAPLLPAF